MKRWALLTVALYLVALAVLSYPGLWLGFGWGPHAKPPFGVGHNPSLYELFDAYNAPIVWIWAAVMVLGQALLLLVPIGSAARRPKPRRKLLVPIVTASFFMALLVFCAGFCLLLVIFGDGSFNGLPLLLAGGLVTACGWAFWGYIFYRFRHTTDPDLLTNRLMRWLLGGSILELLVAVPSHIIVRQRGDCCAPGGTFFGISTGIAVMLMSFGPGVLFLFAKRIDLLRGWQDGHCRVCGYDLRATPTRCPECGTVPKTIRSDAGVR